MKATVISIDDTGLKRLSTRNESSVGLWESRKHTDLKVGDVIQVRRQTNNPYLIRIEEPKS